MSYSSNPLLPKARAEAVRLVIEQSMPLTIAARRCGVHRTTLWRWLRKWELLNQNVQLTNVNRPKRNSDSQVPSSFRLAACTWRIPTNSSRPHFFGRAVPNMVVERIRYYRTKYNRCATIVHAYCKQEGTEVSLQYGSSGIVPTRVGGTTKVATSVASATTAPRCTVSR